MQIIHVYNNNIVSAIRGKQEMIIVGAGIGFHKRPGDTVDENALKRHIPLKMNRKNSCICCWNVHLFCIFELLKS